jgi:hypothetical protein
MRYMNDFDLTQAARRYREDTVPNRARLTDVVTRLAYWANSHSDGWAYWPKPCRAASRAIALIESTAYPEYDRRQREDATDAETKAALIPIKAFLTRQGVPHSVVGL